MIAAIISFRYFLYAAMLLGATISISFALCDVSMPTMNGLELLPSLRRAAPAASILMMSAVGDRSVRNRALAGGATGFVAKPFDRETLTMTLKQALQHHRYLNRTR